jgi:hypothetical protein
MKEQQGSGDSTSSLFLTGSIILANLDSGISDYAIKALVGGLIWMVFKVAGDHISEWIKKK